MGKGPGARARHGQIGCVKVAKKDKFFTLRTIVATVVVTKEYVKTCKKVTSWVVAQTAREE